MDRQSICEIIKNWNESRLDMFVISEPDENLEFHGIIRFFHQFEDGRSTSKCIRCSSQANSAQIIDELVRRFHLPFPSTSTYALWEMQENGQERKLAPPERPLLVQLGWGKDDREGRFILRAINGGGEVGNENAGDGNLRGEELFKRGGPKRFSKNERKKRAQPQPTKEMMQITNLVKQPIQEEDKDFPYTTFTRTISNPEMVMKRRREQKLGDRLRQLENGGTLKIYGVELFPNRPYISLLVARKDSAKQIVQMSLEKYGIESQNPNAFVLVEIFLTEASLTVRSYSELRGVEKRQERLLGDNECPLQILAEQLNAESANVVFFLRRRPASFPPATMPKSITLSNFAGSQCSTSSSISMPFQDSRRRHFSASALFQNNEEEILANQNSSNLATAAQLPCLVPINNFASSANFGAAALAIQPGLTEIGSSSSCAIQLRAPSVLPRHCCLLFREEPNQNGPRVQISLLDKCALVELNGASIHSTVELVDGVQLRIGGIYAYRFFNCVQQQQPRRGSCPGQTYQSSNSSSQPSLASTTTICGEGGPIRERPKNPFAFINHSSNSHQIVDDAGYVDFERPTPTPSTQNTPLSASTPSKEQKPPEGMILLNANNSMMGPMPGQFHHSKTQQAVQTNPSHFMAIPPQRTLPILLECLDSERENQLFLLELFAEDGANPSQQFAMQFHGAQAQTPFGAFRLIPAFSLYALCRHRLHNCHWELQQQLNQNTFARFIDACNRTIKANLGVREVLVYWLANSSELLNIACSDAELAQSVGVLVKELAQLVQHIFNLFVESCRQRCFIGVQNALNLVSLANPMNLIQTGSLLSALDECLRCARWALLNPALSIQLFSQLFHFISASIFNWLVLSPEARPFLTFRFGIRLKGLLQQIQMWAQKQGLELAAECHMDLLAQTINHLTTPKTLEQIAALGATCYKLNSVQVRYLLENYIGDMRSGESPTVGREVVENVVALARQQADQQAQKDPQGQPQLAESNCLNLPFLIPHDGYVVEKIRGIPPDLASFVNRLQQKGIANVLLQQIGQMPIAEMPWNVFFSSLSTRPQVIASTPILGLSSPKGNSASNRTSTPIIPTTMFPPTVPPHQQQQQKGGMGMPIVMPKQKSESPVVYAEVQRRGGANEDYQKQRSVSASILPQTANFPAAGQPNPSSSSILQLKQQQWNERMIDVGGQREVLVQKITIKRAPNEGLGLSIVEMGTPEHGTGIYVKAVISGSPAQKDGRISTGDQLLSVNGQSLLGIQQEMAAQKISGSGPVVHLEVAKKAAQMNGIDHYLQNGYAPQQQQTEIQQQQKANGNGHPPPPPQTMMTTNLGRFNSQPQFQSAGKTTAAGPNGAAIRPTSASELHFHQQQANETAAVMMNPTAIGFGGPYAATTGAANGSSLRNPVIYASTGNHQHQSSSSPYAQLFQHSQQSSSSSSLASRLPAHYKTATNRPQVVLQPGRPASSSPLNSRRSQCTSTPQSDRSTPTMLMLHNDGVANQHSNSNGSTIGMATAPMQIEPPSRGHFAVDYSQLPAIGQLAESPPINSSTTNSTTSGAAEMGMGENGNGRQKHQLQDFHPIMPMPNVAAKHQMATASGRSSAPLFGAEKGGKEMMADQKMEEMERELDELDSSDGQMSDAEQKRYRELLDKLARMRKQKASTNSPNLDNLPPSMLAAAHQLERQSKSLAALSLDPGRAFSPISSSMASKSATNLGGKMMELEQQRKNEAAARELAHQIAAEVAVQQKRKVPPAVPSKPAIREFMRPPATSSTISPVDATAKKRVQFEEENANPSEQRENDEPEEEPRVQIVGAQEIYMNDPRQRRLLELQEANKKLIKPVVDSSALGFREKMRMFAEQIGEKKGPTSSEFRGQQNKSSAERKIEGRKEGDEMAA